MNPIRHIRRFAGVLAAWPGWPLPGGARRYARLRHGGASTRRACGRGRAAGPGLRRSYHRRRRHARLADHPDRGRGRPARGHGRGAPRPRAGHPPERDHHGRLSHPRRPRGAASRKRWPGGTAPGPAPRNTKTSKKEPGMARFTDFHEDLNLPAEVPEIVMNRIPRIRRRRGMPAGLAGVPPTAVAAAPANLGGGAMPSAGTCSVAGSLSFRRIVDLPFEACVAAARELAAHGAGRRPANRPKPPARADRARSRLRYMPDRGPPGPAAAAPAAAHAARRRPLVPAALKDRARTHPLPAGPAHRNLLPGRPPPAGLIDPHAAAALAGTAL